jgi:AbrB family looped-hinge helix DNA binding protein
MKTVITSKFQTTIPKKIREQMHLAIHDSLDWQIERGKIVVLPVQSNFLAFQNSIKTGPGDITADIREARLKRVEKYK